MKLYQILAALFVALSVSACVISAPNVPDPEGGTSPGEASESE